MSAWFHARQSKAALSSLKWAAKKWHHRGTSKRSNHNTHHLWSLPDRSGVANELSRAAVSPSRLLLKKSGSFPWDPSALLLFSSHSWRICQLCWLTLPIRYETPELFSAISFRLVSIVLHMFSASTTAISDSIVVAQYAGAAKFGFCAFLELCCHAMKGSRQTAFPTSSALVPGPPVFILQARCRELHESPVVRKRQADQSACTWITWWEERKLQYFSCSCEMLRAKQADRFYNSNQLRFALIFSCKFNQHHMPCVQQTHDRQPHTAGTLHDRQFSDLKARCQRALQSEHQSLQCPAAEKQWWLKPESWPSDRTSTKSRASTPTRWPEIWKYACMAWHTMWRNQSDWQYIKVCPEPCHGFARNTSRL